MGGFGVLYPLQLQQINEELYYINMNYVVSFNNIII